MKVSRFSINDEVFYGKIDHDKVIRLASCAHDEISLNPTGETYQIDDLKQLLPVNPSNIYGIGDNYPRSKEDRTNPVIFKKSPESMVLNFSKVTLPFGRDVWPEPEIGIVIKKSLLGLNENNFKEYILGYVLVNDVTCVIPNLNTDTHNDESKNQSGFCPVGSFMQTDFNFNDVEILSEINQVPYRNGHSKYFKWSVEKILNELSMNYKLSAGDLIITGCPARLKGEKTFLNQGDVFSSRIEGLGELVTHFEKVEK